MQVSTADTCSVVSHTHRNKGTPALGPTLHHFLRLPSARPSRQHALAGMWKGLYGPHGLEVQRVEYRFDGPSAKIVAVKVLGDANVPAGQLTWKVSGCAGRAGAAAGAAAAAAAAAAMPFHMCM